MAKIADEDRVKLRPPPHSVSIQFGQPWKIVTPSVYRYENAQWIDEFFETGKLRLGSFAKFATYPDEIRGDKSEGTAVCYGETLDNKSVVVAQTQGISAAVLCCSHRLDRQLSDAFDRDSAFEITNTVGFAFEIARQLPGFRHGMEGSCIYRAKRSIERAINFDFEKYKNEDGTVNMQMLVDAGRALGGEELVLLKHKRYEPQQEYRILWELDAIANDHVDVIAPSAVQYCRRIEKKEWD